MEEIAGKQYSRIHPNQLFLTQWIFRLIRQPWLGILTENIFILQNHQTGGKPGKKWPLPALNLLQSVKHSLQRADQISAGLRMIPGSWYREANNPVFTTVSPDL